MTHNAGVHQRRRGIAIFVAEIGADEQPGFAFERQAFEPELGFDLIETILEHFLDLPVPIGEIAQHHAEFGPHREDKPDDVVSLYRQKDSTLSGTVIFPITEAQRNGLEDLRLVEFVRDSGKSEWIGTYTAYSGRDIQSELLRTRDFRDFTLTPIKGGAGRNKGMALFPRKIDRQFFMIGRQDGKNLYLLRSDSIDHWEGGELLLEPRFPWELIQIGNCGAPIELDEGWLVLTHGVGAMRKYAIGAVLLDKDDPSKVIGRTPNPILSAADEDREGYVPNVVYTCGAIRVGDDIFLPYGVADSSVCFAFVAITEILAAMDYSARATA